jgi:hypothetical protein
VIDFEVLKAGIEMCRTLSTEGEVTGGNRMFFGISERNRR